MKKIIVLLFSFFCLTFVTINGQVANGITYQAVALDEVGKEIAGHDINGNIIQSKQIDVRFTILGGDENGEVFYKEVHSIFTDQYGLFSLVIGNGSVSAEGKYQKLMDINWGADKLFLKVEIDIKRSGNFKVMGIQQMMSVPFAFYALTTTKATVNYTDILNMPLFSNVATSGNYNDLLNKPVIFDGNYYSLTNKPILFNGNYNSLTNKPDLFDGDYNSLTNKPLIASETTDEFLAVAGQTAFTLKHVPSVIGNLKMYINGVRISNSAYSKLGTTLTYIPANNGSNVLRTGDRIQVDYSY
jgi:hypothetical protein